MPIEVFMWVLLCCYGVSKRSAVYEEYSPAEETSLRQKYWTLLVNSFSLASMHGVNYAAGLNYVLLRVFWLLLVASFTTFSAFSSLTVLMSYYEDPWLITLQDPTAMAATEAPYPTITICADQLPDKYNLPRIGLNLLEDQIRQDFAQFVNTFERRLATHDWLPDSAVQDEEEKIGAIDLVGHEAFGNETVEELNDAFAAFRWIYDSEDAIRNVRDVFINGEKKANNAWQ